MVIFVGFNIDYHYHDLVRTDLCLRRGGHLKIRTDSERE